MIKFQQKGWTVVVDLICCQNGIRHVCFKISQEVEIKRETQHIHKNINEIIISKYCQSDIYVHTHTHTSHTYA